jgi:hypothetical protein
MSIKEKLKKKLADIKDDLAFQKMQSKSILKTKWDIGAEAGKKMKKDHKDKIKKVVKKDGNKSKR